GDGDTALGDSRKKPRGGVVHHQRLQVPVVHADDVGADRERSLELAFVAHLDKSVETAIYGSVKKIFQLRRIESAHDEQNGRCAGSARLKNLEIVDDEILAEERKRRRLPRFCEVGKLASESRRLGEN